jgi:hypothetical protein
MVLGSLGMLAVLHGAQAGPTEPRRSAASSYQLPLAFEANQGQTSDRVRFLARGPGYNIFLTASEAVFALPRASAVRMQLIGSAADPQVQGVDALPGKVNYFRGKDAAGWQSRVPIYQRVRYSAVYPGIDLVYYGKSQQLEYDFIVAPGADPGAIKLAFAGVERTTVDARGDLILKTAGAPPLRFQTPVIYQTDGGGRHAVDGGYVRRGPHQIGFRVGAYDRTRPLIIDPVLSYSTYLGGSGVDEGDGIAVDATGAVYVSGVTTSTDFPSANRAQPASGEGGSADIFVAKFTPDGTALVYTTYLGGSKDEGAADIAVDAAGAAYIGAVTLSSDFPTFNAFQPATGGGLGLTAVVAKLSADGSRLIYSTYLGDGNFDRRLLAIAVDPAGAAYIAGATFSADFPLVNAAHLWPGDAGGSNAIVAKLAPDGSALLYSTYLGGLDRDEIYDIAVDSLGAAFVTGLTLSADFPGAHTLAVPGVGSDAFVAKLAPDGSRFIYSTTFGGSASDHGRGIAVDITGSAYVTGSTSSTDFPTKNAVQAQQRSESFGNAFVVKIAPEGDAMIYGTYLGGTTGDSGYGIAVDTAGSAYVTGITGSRDFPTKSAIQRKVGGHNDAFVAKLSPDGGSLVYSTYLGGSDEDGYVPQAPRQFVESMAITVDLAGATYVTGQTRSPDFPTVNALQPMINADVVVCVPSIPDAFVVKIVDDSLASPAPGPSIASAPAVESASSGASAERRRGGGAMDALFLALLAPLAVAGGMRRRRRSARRVG